MDCLGPFARIAAAVKCTAIQLLNNARREGECTVLMAAVPRRAPLCRSESKRLSLSLSLSLLDSSLLIRRLIVDPLRCECRHFYFTVNSWADKNGFIDWDAQSDSASGGSSTCRGPNWWIHYKPNTVRACLMLAGRDQHEEPARKVYFSLFGEKPNFLHKVQDYLKDFTL